MSFNLDTSKIPAAPVSGATPTTGILQGLAGLLQGLGVLAGKNKNKVSIADTDLGRTVGAFLSVQMGLPAANPVQSVGLDGAIKHFSNPTPTTLSNLPPMSPCANGKCTKYPQQQFNLQPSFKP